MPACPLCGSRHDTKGGVNQHMFMQATSDPDGDHYHIKSKADAYQASTNDNDSEDGVTKQYNDSRNDDPEPDGGSGELDFPENPDASDPDPEPDSEPSRSRCTECGSGNYASSDLALEKIPNLSDRAKRALKAHEYHCHDCGEVFDL